MIVMLHGFTHTGQSWAPVRAELGRGYLSLAPDLRGHGLAADSSPVELAAVLGDLGPVIPPGGTVCGYSMGGRLGLHAALDPEIAGRIGRLVLIGASPGLADRRERDARRAADEKLADELEQMSIEQLADRWAMTPILADQSAEVRNAARLDRLRNHPRGLAAALRGLGTGALPSLWNRLGELAMPVTLVVGERDEKFRALAAAMAERIPRVEVEVVASAGHAVHLERPERIAALLRGDSDR